LRAAIPRVSSNGSFQKTCTNNRLQQIRQYADPLDGQPLRRLQLHDFHKSLGGKMVPFCGWEMPVQYGDSIIQSHLHTRQNASLFDVSHMQQLHVLGKDRTRFLEELVVGDLQSLPEGHAKLSVITNEQGGIIDDTVISNRGGYYYVVVNAACAEKDLKHMYEQLARFKRDNAQNDVSIVPLDRSLIAIQGPLAEKSLTNLLSPLDRPRLEALPFMNAAEFHLPTVGPCLVSRCGYTGEDGFEISVDHNDVESLATKLLAVDGVKPAGLGARDTLRLEAGLCLYGNDLNENTTPIEAALGWLPSKRRKAEGGFLGAKAIQDQIANPSLVKQKRVGLIMETNRPAREHTPIYKAGTDELIGEVGSGSFSPVMNRAISMGYVDVAHQAVGTVVDVKIKGKTQSAVVSKMPFVPHTYKREPAKK